MRKEKILAAGYRQFDYTAGFFIFRSQVVKSCGYNFLEEERSETCQHS